MKRSLKAMGLATFLIALAALLLPSIALAGEDDQGENEEQNFGFVGVAAMAFPTTGTVVVSFETVRDSPVNYYEIQYAADLPTGVYISFTQTLESQKTQDSRYIFSDYNPGGSAPNSFLFIRVVAHFESGETLTSDPVMVATAGRRHHKPLDW